MGKSLDLVNSQEQLPDDVLYVVQKVKPKEHLLTFNLRIVNKTEEAINSAHEILKEWQLAVQSIGPIYFTPTENQQKIIDDFWNKVPAKCIVDYVQLNADSSKIVYRFEEPPKQSTAIEYTKQLDYEYKIVDLEIDKSYD